MKKLLLATSNPAKIKEIQLGLLPLIKKGINILTLTDLNIKTKVQETGKTFEENAKIKAKFFGDLTGYPTIADDGGLLIPVLDNQPGVKSRRWLGYDAGDRELINYTLTKLQGISKREKLAFLQTCICFYDPNQNNYICEQEKITGHIAEKPSSKRVEGYPYRSLFVVDKFNKYYDELTEEEHKKINHRLKALNKLISVIPNSFQDLI